MATGSALMQSAGRSLGATVLAAARAYPGRPALEVGGASLTYAQLADDAGRIAGCVSGSGERPALGAVFGTRTAAAYQGVLGTLLAGCGYVPLNPKFPDARTAYMLGVSGAASLVIDAESVARIEAITEGVERPLLIVVPDLDDLDELRRAHPRHRFAGKGELAAVTPLADPPAVDEDAIAYLMFTSGSTGSPKGVMVSHRNALHHLDVMWSRYAVRETDRFSQAFDLTFDLSVFDMFVAWGRGAALCVIPAREMLAPAKFIQSRELTIWFSVPSVATVLKRLRMLSPGAFPTLRWSLFCGERLPDSIAQAWQAAAPASIVENLYGPTEVTIACTLHRWDPQTSPGRCVGGVVPIGVPYPGMSAAVVGPGLELVGPAERGELCMKGPQVTPGYWRDPARTAERYVAMPWDAGPDNRWYRTGDVAFVDAHGDLVHCGRNDDQVKIRGYRVELAEIEHVLRECAGTEMVAVVPWPVVDAGFGGVVAFAVGVAGDPAAVLDASRRRLADYMVPSELRVLDELPYNANGKVDRRRLAALLEEADAGSQ